MDNTTYEFFIRRCWSCERFKHGANTDTWEILLINHFNLKNSNSFDRKVAEKEYLKQLTLIKDYLNKAFNKLISIAQKKKINSILLLQITKYQDVVNKSVEPQEIYDILRNSFILINDNNLLPVK